MDLHWDTILGVVAGDNYKVSAQWTDPLAEVGKRRAVAHGVVYEALREGDGEEHDLWDCSHGNIVLASNNFGDRAMLKVFVILIMAILSCSAQIAPVYLQVSLP